jgi:hypothetical protein
MIRIQEASPIHCSQVAMGPEFMMMNHSLEVADEGNNVVGCPEPVTDSDGQRRRACMQLPKLNGNNDDPDELYNTRKV